MKVNSFLKTLLGVFHCLFWEFEFTQLAYHFHPSKKS